jgi:ABC-type sugar transport system substrate-binding protein
VDALPTQELDNRNPISPTRLTFALSLITRESDYQQEQAVSAQECARRLKVDIEISYADNDAIKQSQQLLQIIQKRSREVNALIFEPAGNTAFPQVAGAAVAAGLGWVVMNRSDDSISELRQRYGSPICSVTEDHKETGRILGRQVAALLPQGGTLLCLQGPSSSPVTASRLAGMEETKPTNINLKFLRSAQWTEEGGYNAVAAWLRLSTSHDAAIIGIMGQSDLIALGAYRAFRELAPYEKRDYWLRLPFLGVNGLKLGRDAVQRGTLAATVVVPPSAAVAIESLVRAYREGVRPAERIFVTPKSFPELAVLASRGEMSQFPIVEPPNRMK